MSSDTLFTQTLLACDDSSEFISQSSGMNTQCLGCSALLRDLKEGAGGAAFQCKCWHLLWELPGSFWETPVFLRGGTTQHFLRSALQWREAGPLGSSWHHTSVPLAP